MQLLLPIQASAMGSFGCRVKNQDPVQSVPTGIIEFQC
jgi:hypothetical protein